jgi:hypothetical protein
LKLFIIALEYLLSGKHGRSLPPSAIYSLERLFPLDQVQVFHTPEQWAEVWFRALSLLIAKREVETGIDVSCGVPAMQLLSGRVEQSLHHSAQKQKVRLSVYEQCTELVGL